MDRAQPAVSLDHDEIDLGTLVIGDERSVEFVLTNTGTAPLTIARVRTSCKCAVAEIIIAGERSPRFTMDSLNRDDARAWTGSLAPGGQALVRMTYHTALSPVPGPGRRFVMLQTNGPRRATVVLRLRATLRPSQHAQDLCAGPRSRGEGMPSNQKVTP